MKETSTKRLVALLMAVMLLVGTLTGCGSSNGNSNQQDNPQDSSQGGSDTAVTDENGEVIDTTKDTITMTVDREPASLDPAVYVSTYNAHDQIYEGLVTYDLDGNIVPLLAESYEQVDDVTWTFKLREDVYFHNGEHMTSADVLYTFKRAMTFPQAANMLSNLDAESFAAPDEYTFTLKTKQPYAFTLNNLCELYLTIVNEKAIKDAGSDEAFGRNPVGTGPYKFVNWVAADSITLERFDDYWGEPAKIKNVVFKYIIEPTTRTIDLESGGSDINWVVANEDYERVANGDNTTVLKYSIAATRYFPLNVTKKPLE